MKTTGGARRKAGALFFFLAATALAQETATLSGEGDIDFVARSGTINEASLWTPGGLPRDHPLRDADTIVHPRLLLRIEGHAERWNGRLEIGNVPLESDTADTRRQNDWLGGEDAALHLRAAWIELFDVARIGVQPFLWDPIGRGHPLFLEPSASESPWGAGEPQTLRDTMQPVGLTLHFPDLTIFGLVVAEGGRASEDETLVGAAWTPSFGAIRGGAILALLGGSGPTQSVLTAGLALRWESGPFAASAEAYAQKGAAGRIDVDGDGRADRLHASSSAGRLIARYADGFWAQVTLLQAGGDERATDDQEGRFLSYENNDATLIIEGNEFGLDVDSNYRTLQISGGGEFTLFRRSIRPRAILAAFRFLEEVRRSDDLGVEADLAIEVACSAQVTVSVEGAALWGAEALETFTRDRENRALLFTAGAAWRF